MIVKLLCSALPPPARSRENRAWSGLLAPRGDRPVAGPVFKKADHQHLQIHHRVDVRPLAARWVRISRLANSPHLPVEIHLLQRGIDRR